MPQRRKLAVEQQLSTGGVRQGAVLLYALVTIALVSVAVYMGVVEQRPVLSGWVAAPAIGALWFGLRLFMILGSRK